MKFAYFLLVLEGIWIALFVSLCITSFALTNGLVPNGDDIRSDIFALRTHIILPSLIVAVIKASYVTQWLYPLLFFILFTDVCNLVELAHFSAVRESAFLYPASLTVVSFQIFIILLTVGYLIYLKTSKREKWQRKGVTTFP